MTQTVHTPVPLVERIDQLLPQTQCRRCGYDDCRGYAEALAQGDEAINRCPPGRDDTIAALAQLLGRPVLPLADDLAPMPVRQTVRIDPAHCIGCTKCILACPVDAIVGAPRFMHQVLADRCTGCELCLSPCPTDCIEVLPLRVLWQDADARLGRQHYGRHQQRLAAERQKARLHRSPSATGPRQHAPMASTGQAAPTDSALTTGSSTRHAPPLPAPTPALAAAAPTVPAAHAASQAAPVRVDVSGPLADAPAASTTPPAPAAPVLAATSRDPLVALAGADEKARRLAALRQKLAAGKQHG